jgi:hypothetical protein
MHRAFWQSLPPWQPCRRTEQTIARRHSVSPRFTPTLLCASALLVAAFSAVGNAQQGTAPSREQVYSILDSWKGREDALSRVAALPPTAATQVGEIAADDNDTYEHRSHAITILGATRQPDSVAILGRIADGGRPAYRCLAIQALAEIGSKEALPVLIRQLDAHDACMSVTSTDPARETPVLVSDEAVRALEKISGRSFRGAAEQGGHAATEPWKLWWQRQRRR